MRKFILAAVAASLAIPTAPAMADQPRRYYNKKAYDSHGRYVEPRRLDRSDRIWRGRDGRYYCKRDNGTTGLVIGAAVGGLAGHEIAGSGDKTLGAIIGAVGGGLLGRAIDRGDVKCR
ncbi:MAG: glycine zipper 2TM domain-containing protein [Novosphingobium sp.]|uniref:glycine zipper 2TM domain-containing protein n=1 Tax=Tsuneonella sp. CC-YZS046 TaxID=3042152 RepID=UPI002D77A45E|nr:glycine zipper 2TM domain-containing protein [Tsuneonella sp. CC-YZS046]WRO68007.1 glycine zipper 2TM domain-containing protein [Tsuneonella sp. CC-YZS046]